MMMHRHEWTLKYQENLEAVGIYGLPAYCIKCNATMISEEIERRLNATEALSAELEELKELTVGRIREYIQSMGDKTEVEVWGQDMVLWLIDEHKKFEADVTYANFMREQAEAGEEKLRKQLQQAQEERDAWKKEAEALAEGKDTTLLADRVFSELKADRDALVRALERIANVASWAGKWYVGEDFNEYEGTGTQRLMMVCEWANEATRKEIGQDETERDGLS
jgi:hypothetical protein